ncbi:MAG: hypothetical protein LBI81_02290 [Puniceicoccales bacterium]|jgi:hypothetical protein|nr:hypothetical protein [Puniceicoccales bacterium]
MKLLKKLFVFLMLVAPIFSSGEEFESLTSNSPFGEREVRKNGELSDDLDDSESPSVITYELRGVFIKNSAKTFNLCLSNEKYMWVKQGDITSEIVIRTYDDSTKTLYFTTIDGVEHFASLKNAPTTIGKLSVAIPN